VTPGTVIFFVSHVLLMQFGERRRTFVLMTLTAYHGEVGLGGVSKFSLEGHARCLAMAFIAGKSL